MHSFLCSSAQFFVQFIKELYELYEQIALYPEKININLMVVNGYLKYLVRNRRTGIRKQKRGKRQGESRHARETQDKKATKTQTLIDCVRQLEQEKIILIVATVDYDPEYVYKKQRRLS